MAISILMYHQIGEFPPPTAHRACFCHIRRFRAQMAYLYYGGYRVLSLNRIQSVLAGATRSDPSVRQGRVVALTFDDAYRNFYQYAWPVLARYRFPATVFAVAGRVGQGARWLADGDDDTPLMTPGQLREIAGHSVTIGSHSLTHPRLDKMPIATARREIEDSKALLEDLLGRAVLDFAYPYGRYDPAVRGAVEEAGYRMALTCIRGAAEAASNLFEVPRKAVSYGDSLLGYCWKLHLKNRPKACQG